MASADTFVASSAAEAAAALDATVEVPPETDTVPRGKVKKSFSFGPDVKTEDYGRFGSKTEILRPDIPLQPLVEEVLAEPVAEPPRTKALPTAKEAGLTLSLSSLGMKPVFASSTDLNSILLSKPSIPPSFIDQGTSTGLLSNEEISAWLAGDSCPIITYKTLKPSTYSTQKMGGLFD